MPLLRFSWADGQNEPSCLAALGDSGDDGVVLNVVRVVGLDVGSKTVEGALDGFLGGRVHHAGLKSVSSVIVIASLHVLD